jgi:hypothetical protein
LVFDEFDERSSVANAEKRKEGLQMWSGGRHVIYPGVIWAGEAGSTGHLSVQLACISRHLQALQPDLEMPAI